jgi:hypothetical protein
MRKLKMDVEALQVESFVVQRHAAQGGTVQGQSGTTGGPTDGPLFPDPDSTDCDGGAWGSLFGTCAGCPTVGTCIGATYCCQPTWRPTCNPTCDRTDCGLPCSL